MLFPEPLQPATLLRRYKRFLADVRLPDGNEITIHCPNSGSMLGCNAPGLPVMISRATNLNRKYPHTLEMVKVGATWVGVNTALTNRLVHEAMIGGLFPELGRIDAIRPEVKIGNSRLDFRLETEFGTTWVEVKNCSLAVGATALFPDAVTERGTRHLQELLALRQIGQRATIIFCIQREDAERFSPAREIDPLYAATLSAVVEQGVLALAGQTSISPAAITLDRRLPIIFSDYH